MGKPAKEGNTLAKWPTGRPFGSSPLMPAVTVILALAIFVLDSITRLEIAVAVFYVAVVLLSQSFCGRRGVLATAFACVALTILSYIITRNGSFKAGIINSIISIAAIGATTYLALKIEAARVAAQKAQEQLAHIARVTTLGELAASIAHEVNQPLGAIAANGNAAINWLIAQPPNLGEVKQSVTQMVDDANRASEIVARVRRLAKRTPHQNELVDINSTIQEVARLMRSDLDRKGIALRTQLSPDLPVVEGDRVELQQVLLNLIVNSAESLDAGGVGTSREIFIRSAKHDSRNICVSVADSGGGFDPDKLDRLFDAFHTTKSHGMGMGLTISRSIIEAHGGYIKATPNVPAGALVQFFVPFTQRTA
ncbi:MAG TPA: ATP-binding protein [Terriglobales bacterium]|nr:ATP-binding protein [Terriglobales bacterium]